MPSARDAVDAALDRISAPAVRSSMITVTADRARREAEASDGRRRRRELRSDLDGVLVAWKDLFDVAGTVTTAGSALCRGRAPAAVDSSLVHRLAGLGMVTVGKTNLSELAFSGLGLNDLYGTPVNPLDPALVPGGSSSGAAVAVAAGVVPVAIGTDTSGSVRVPAAFTGCVGFRASRNRYGHNDFRPLSPTLDSVGVLARSVADIRRLDRHLSGRPVGAAVRRVVVPAGEWIDDCTVGVASTFEVVCERLRAAGIDVVTQRLESMQTAQDLMDRHGTVVGAEAYAAYGVAPQAQPATRRRLRRSAEMAPGPLIAALPSLRQGFRAELDGAVALCPTVRHEPPRIADLAGDDAAYDAANASTLRTTMVLSHLGACGVSIPCGDTGVGALLSAPYGEDGMVLATAELVEGLLTDARVSRLQGVARSPAPP